MLCAASHKRAGVLQGLLKWHAAADRHVWYQAGLVSLTCFVCGTWQPLLGMA